jgi:hypothetical protein
MRPAVDGHEILTLELEGDRHDGALGSRPALAAARARDEARFPEQRDVEATASSASLSNHRNGVIYCSMAIVLSWR